ncbi:MAG: flap endonuclease [Deltaproteobacteria bacterium]|nr:MAG: flap endonuclease [Deltaproteobacteria bacterium]TMQ07234.1 MAG: flap endonuclease [Deltaproteobacteria bacterium]
MQVHLIDGTYELFRAWFGAPQAQAHGREVGAVRSLVRSFAMMLGRPAQPRPAGERSRLPMTHVGVAFDHVIESFRNDLFAGYKTGEGLPEGLVSQFELAERASAALGLVVWPMVEFEADDAIATAAHRLAADAAVERVLITAVDKDLCQCVAGDRVVCWDRFKDQTLDEAGVIAKHGVPPASIPDLLALVGDTADGIPGIAGWGKSSAAKLLTAYGHIPDIPDDPTAWTVAPRGADRLALALRGSRAEVALYRTLATLRIDCPIACDAASLAWRGVNRPALDAICDELGVERASLRLAIAEA